MPTATADRHLRIRTEDDLVQTVPFLVGFTPRESLVICIVDQGRIGVTARADLSDLAGRGQVESLMRRLLARFPAAEGAWVIAYTDTDTGVAWNVIGRAIVQLPVRSGYAALVVSGDEWENLNGETGLVHRDGATAAQAAAQGLVRRDGREDVEATLAAPANTVALARRSAMVLNTLEPLTPDTARAGMATMLRDSSVSGVVSFAQAVKLAQLASNKDARQIAVLSLTPATAVRQLEVWRSVVTQVPDQVGRGALLLAGWAAWLCGEGALTSIALNRVGTETALAKSLGLLVDQAVPPSHWPAHRAEALNDAGPQVRAHVTL